MCIFHYLLRGIDCCILGFLLIRKIIQNHSLESKCVDVVLRVGSKHQISGQNVLFATCSRIAQIHSCSQWSVGVIPGMLGHSSEQSGWGGDRNGKGLEAGNLSTGTGKVLSEAGPMRTLKLFSSHWCALVVLCVVFSGVWWQSAAVLVFNIAVVLAWMLWASVLCSAAI